jgi:hypothetical protein
MVLTPAISQVEKIIAEFLSLANGSHPELR